MSNFEALYTLILVLVAVVVCISAGSVLALYKVAMTQMATLEKAYSQANPQVQQGIEMLHKASEITENLLKQYAPGSKLTETVDKVEDILDEMSDGVPASEKGDKSIDEIVADPEKYSTKNTLDTDVEPQSEDDNASG